MPFSLNILGTGLEKKTTKDLKPLRSGEIRSNKNSPAEIRDKTIVTEINQTQKINSSAAIRSKCIYNKKNTHETMKTN